jgi:V8-like Glu-specific endopeptidase
MTFQRPLVRQAMTCACCTGLLAASCSSPHEELPDVEMSIQNRQALAQIPDKTEFVDAKGRRWIRHRKIVDYAPERIGEFSGRELEPNASLERLSLDDLAEALRPIGFANGYEYRAAEPAYDTAARIIALRAQAARGEPDVLSREGNTGSAPTPEVRQDVAPKRIFPPDTRAAQGANTVYPYRTVVLLTDANLAGSCTATFIGPSTAVTAAHCLHDSANWFSTRRWAPGADSGDTVRFPFDPFGPYPSTNPSNPATLSCYWANVPQCWYTWPWIGSSACDFAVIEFANGFPNCNLQPGNVVGWLGWGWASTAEMQAWSANVYGYPVADNTCGGWVDCPGANCMWPKIWGTLENSWQWDSDTEYLIGHHVDTGPGQSGSALYNFAPGYRKVYGIHQGCHSSSFGTSNRARRIDNSVVTFVEDNSAL